MQIRTRSTRTTVSDLSRKRNGENLSNNLTTISERKSTGISQKSVRSQKTIATATTDTSHTSCKLD